MNNRKIATKEDIDRNYKLFEDGKALDMPLAYLDGKLKAKVRTTSDKYKAYQKAYRKSDKYKACKKAYRKSDKYKACKKAYYLKNKRLSKQGAK